MVSIPRTEKQNKKYSLKFTINNMIMNSAMGMEQPKVNAGDRVSCMRCGYGWMVRGASAPVACPKCKAREWWRLRGAAGRKSGVEVLGDEVAVEVGPPGVGYIKKDVPVLKGSEVLRRMRGGG
jgi:hypothetical protein